MKFGGGRSSGRGGRGTRRAGRGFLFAARSDQTAQTRAHSDGGPGDTGDLKEFAAT
jgi:hypothetical protein